MPDDIYNDNEDYGTFDPTVPPVRLGDLITIAAFVMIAVPLVGAGIVVVVRGLG